MKRIFVTLCILSFGLFACSGTSSDGDTTLQPDATIGEDAPIEGDVPGDICEPQCEGRICGDDGCQGSCGLCPPNITCVEGLCPCTPECTGKECGIDGCGGYCGKGGPATEGCDPEDMCENGMCLPFGLPQCDGKECGPDGNDGSCGTCPCEECELDELQCSSQGLCEPIPECDCPCILDCLGTCPEGDPACAQNCINEASLEYQVPYNDLITCLDQSGYFDCAEDDQDCLDEAFAMCMSQYYECFHGDMPCKDLYLCLTDCPGGDAGQVCSSECFSNGTVEALGQWDDFIDCIDENGYFDCAEDDDDCYQAAWDACSAEFIACAHGDLNCSEIFDCLDTCAPTDQMCRTSCLISGTVEAQEVWDSMGDCVVEQCGEEGDVECENSALEGACSGVYNACIGN
jgi:hypothetical protein